MSRMATIHQISWASESMLELVAVKQALVINGRGADEGSLSLSSCQSDWLASSALALSLSLSLSFPYSSPLSFYLRFGKLKLITARER